MPEVSVIIPTYNNRHALIRTLRALFAQQSDPDRYEVIVIDDGSTDGTPSAVDALDPPVRLRYHRQVNGGRAAARNAGARLAEGRILLFLDSDMIASPDLVARHLAHYRRHRGQIAVQGGMLIDPACKVTLFMQTRESTLDLTYRRRRNMSPFQVATRNLSVRAEDFWAAGGFDERFVGYGWEDIDLGLRLHHSGVRIFYDPRIVAFHSEVESLDRMRAKFRQSGESAMYFWRKHRTRWGMGLLLEIHPILLPLKWLVYRTRPYGRLARRMLVWAERTQNAWVAGECYNYLIWEAYYDGVFSALRDDGAGSPFPESDQIADP